MTLMPNKYFDQTFYMVRCLPHERARDSHRTRPAHNADAYSAPHGISSCSCSPSARRERRRRADAHGMRAHGRRESGEKQGRVAAVRSAPAR